MHNYCKLLWYKTWPNKTFQCGFLSESDVNVCYLYSLSSVCASLLRCPCIWLKLVRWQCLINNVSNTFVCVSNATYIIHWWRHFNLRASINWPFCNILFCSESQTPSSGATTLFHATSSPVFYQQTSTVWNFTEKNKWGASHFYSGCIRRASSLNLCKSIHCFQQMFSRFLKNGQLPGILKKPDKTFPLEEIQLTILKQQRESRREILFFHFLSLFC